MGGGGEFLAPIKALFKSPKTKFTQKSTGAPATSEQKTKAIENIDGAFGNGNTSSAVSKETGISKSAPTIEKSGRQARRINRGTSPGTRGTSVGRGSARGSLLDSPQNAFREASPGKKRKSLLGG